MNNTFSVSNIDTLRELNLIAVQECLPTEQLINNVLNWYAKERGGRNGLESNREGK